MNRPTWEMIQLFGLELIDTWLDTDPASAAPSAGDRAHEWHDQTGSQEMPDLHEWTVKRSELAEKIEARVQRALAVGDCRRAARIQRMAPLDTVTMPVERVTTRFYGIRLWRPHPCGRRVLPKPHEG